MQKLHTAKFVIDFKLTKESNLVKKLHLRNLPQENWIWLKMITKENSKLL